MQGDAVVKQDEDDDSSEAGESGDMTQLGFLERPLHSLCMLRDFFPCKVGGKPAWLNPVNIPSTEELTCSFCEKPLKFLLQLYAPRDTSPKTFHRTLFVFVCEGGACVAKGSVRVFRSQLGRENPFYPSTAPKKPAEDERDGELPIMESGPAQNGPKLCYVCGARASKACSACKNVHYCSREHQIKHWKASHKSKCKSDQEEKQCIEYPRECEALGYLFPEQEIVIDLEDEDSNDEGSDESGDDDEQNTTDSKTHSETTAVTTATPKAQLTSKDSLDEHTQSLLTRYEQERNEMGEGERKKEDKIFANDDLSTDKSKKQDPVFQAFSKRVARFPDQVLRFSPYQSSVAPLWVSADHKADMSQIPICERCSKPRAFEFQILPQLLFYLNVDSGQANALDWGTVAVFTCSSADCGDGETSYAEEHTHVQMITQSNSV